MDEAQRVLEASPRNSDLAEVSRLHGEVEMARFVVRRVTEFVKANPLTMEATPQPLKTFLADLFLEINQRLC